MNRIAARSSVLLLVVVLALAGCRQAPPTPAPTSTPAPQAPRTLTALVGAGQETTDVNAFFPASLHIRAGDTIAWKINGDEIHTVTFLGGDKFPEFAVPVPGGGPGDFMANPKLAFPTRGPGAPVETYSGTSYVHSGIMSKQPQGPGAPPNDTFSLTFDKPGTYKYICAVHGFPMQAEVVVEPNTATDVPDQAAIDAQAKAEMEPLLAQVEAAKQFHKDARQEPGPNGATFWYVQAGVQEFIEGDARVQAMEFLPKNLTVKSGDTVVWASSFFHTVTFNPAPPPPEVFLPKPQAQGPPQLILNPKIFAPAKPSPVYDPTQYYNSGDLGVFSQGGGGWALTFDKPGTYDYFCAVHRDLGMKGTITVETR